MHRVITLCLMCNLFTGLQAGVVSFISPCKFDDKECVKREAQKTIPYIADGIADLGIPAADPIVLQDVRADDGDLKLGFNHLSVVGPKHCQFDTIEFTSESSLAFTVFCPVTATGKYEVGGKLLGIPIEGSGPFEIKTDKVKISVDANFEKKSKDGKDYWHIKSVKHSYDANDKIHFKLENLYNGDEAKAKPIIDILNVSGKELVLTIGKPVIDELINKEVAIIEKFFDAVPADELLKH